MDKRTLLFVILVGLTFVGFNLYLSHERDKTNREILQKKEAQKAKEWAQFKDEALKKTASPSTLPLISIYGDKEENKIVAKGINVKGATLTLSWTPHPPKTVFVNGKMQTLQTEGAIMGAPIVYASSDFTNLEIASLPESGVFDIQIVSFSPTGSVEVYYGQYKEGTLTIPLGKPTTDGIGLFKTDAGYLPLGFYEASSNLFIEMQNLPLLSSLTKSLSQPLATPSKEQQYYVLENPYLQLVFSNVGGALSEINLPLKSKQDSLSVVKEIQFDREIQKQSPLNSHFPLHPYFTAFSKSLQQAEKPGGYYPLIRRSLITQKKNSFSPQYYALNVVSEYPEMAELIYEVKAFTPDSITFEASQPHRKITKTFTLGDQKGAPYCFDLSMKIEGDSRGLWLTSGVPEVEIMSNSSSPQMQYRLTRKGKVDMEKLDLPKPKEMLNVSSVTPDWVVNSNGYLGVIMDPLKELTGGFRATAIAGETIPTRLSLIDPQYHPYPSSKYPGYQVLIPLPSRGGAQNMRIYAGPFEEATLKKVDETFSNAETGYNPDYRASITFYGWFSFISEPFAKFLFVVMKFFYQLTHSWAFAIILLTVFLRILLYPLNAWSIKSMKRMQLISPQVQALQQKYKKDPKKAQMEIMNLYREKKVNPFTGCIPILIQIPFLIAMFDLLKSSFQLRGASFIPGWIDDLTAPDVLFQWKQPIFFIGNQFHLLPILLGVVMFFQQRLSSPLPKDKSQWTDQQRQQRAMGTIMTVVFSVMFYHFPSGLNLYWLSSMVLGIGQQSLTNRWLEKNKSKQGDTIEVNPKKLASKKK